MPGEARQEVFGLRQLDLQAAFAGAGAAGEHVQDEGGSVEDFDALGERALQVALLGGREFVVADDGVETDGAARLADLLQFAFADVGLGGRVEALGHRARDLRAGGVHELREFVERVAERRGGRRALDADAQEQGALAPLAGLRGGLSPRYGLALPCPPTAPERRAGASLPSGAAPLPVGRRGW